MASYVPTGWIPLRSWFENQDTPVNWDQSTGNVSAGDYTFRPEEYYLDPTSNRTYVDPSAIARTQGMGMLRDIQNRYGPEGIGDRFQDMSGIAKSMLQPQYDVGAANLDRLLRRIQSTVDANEAMAQAGWGQAFSNLERAEGRAQEGATSGISASNIASSPLAEYQRRKVTEAYAPEYQQLATQEAAHLQSIASQAMFAAEELAAQGKALEADFMTQVGQMAWGMLEQQQAQEHSRFDDLMKVLGFHADMGTTQLSHALNRAQTFGKVGPMDTKELGHPIGTPTLDRDLGFASLAAPQAARGGGGGGAGGLSILDQMRLWEFDQTRTAAEEEQQINAQIKEYQKKYGVSSEVAATMLYVLEAPSRESAMAELEGLGLSGTAKNQAQQAIVDKYGSPAIIQTHGSQGPGLLETLRMMGRDIAPWLQGPTSGKSWPWR